MSVAETTEAGAGTTPVPALRVAGVTKRFGDVIANDDVSLDLAPGEIHALLGENGAGKTTLMNIVFGVVSPDEGTLELGGEPIEWGTPREAIERGIGMVHQHFMLIPTLTVAENVFLNVISMPAGKGITLREVGRQTAELGREYGLAVDPRALIDALSVGEKLRVEIVKVLMQGRLRGGLRAFILDEPTALLTPQETQRLFGVLRQLASEGAAIVMITHKLEEVAEISDRVTVLRDARVIETLPTASTTSNELATLMVGRPLPERRRERVTAPGEVVLEVRGVSASDDGHELLKDVSLEVRAGEILGVAGVAGNGQDILAQCITGLRTPSAGTIALNGRDSLSSSRRDLVERDVAHVPEDRRGSGLVTTIGIKHNLILGLHRWPAFQARGWLRWPAIAAHGARLASEYHIRARSLDQPVDHLSGGNQQRVILGRELGKEPQLIVASEATRGRDVAGDEYVHDRLVEQRDRGAAILLISLDLDELLTLSDRLIVMQGGRVVGELDAAEADPAKLGLMMGGTRVAAGTAGS